MDERTKERLLKAARIRMHLLEGRDGRLPDGMDVLTALEEGRAAADRLDAELVRRELQRGAVLAESLRMDRDAARAELERLKGAFGHDGHRYALPCVCNSLPSLAHLRHWTRRDVEAAGLLLADPTMPSRAGTGQARQRPAVGEIGDSRARERVRHLPEAERMDYGAAAGEVW